jgi:hypothetical protein
MPQRVRSGASSGLDLILPNGEWVNAPVYASRLEGRATLECDGEQFWIAFANRENIPVKLVPSPSYYGLKTRTGLPMKSIGQMFADRIGFGLTNNCYFWKKERRCSFCTIGLNVGEESRSKSVDEIIDTLLAATNDTIFRPRHILLSGGTFPSEGWSTQAFSTVAAHIRSISDLPIYLMAVPPSDLGEFQELFQSGITELALNIEIYNQDKAATIVPGKAREIGLSRYGKALLQARSLWSTQQVRSLLVAGLESMESTMDGVKFILDHGATPILSAFRPLKGSALESHPYIPVDFFYELYERAQMLAASYGTVLGPSCLACRANCIA